MRALWIIAQYDLLRSMKARETFLFGLLMPALMMLLLGIAMGGADDGPTLTVDVIDEDGSDLSAQFVAMLQDELEADESFRLCTLHAPAAKDCDLDAKLPDQPDRWRTTADERLEDTDSFGVLILEAGFGAALRAGEPVTVIYKNSADLSAPALAEQKIDAAISRMNGAVAIANLTTDVALVSFSNLDRAATFDAVRAEVEAAWDTRPIRVISEETGTSISRAGFNQSGPGIAIMFVLIFMLNNATMLVYERETGTLQRLFTLPVPRWTILAGKILGRYLYGLALFALLVLMGRFMGVAWGDNVAGILLTMLVYTLTVTALGLALATVVRTSAQAANLSSLLGMTLAPLGGAWWPLEIVPDFMKTIGHLSPVAWGMDAFQEMMFYGGTVADILPMMGVLLAMAGVFFAFGVFRFRYE